MAAKQVSGGLSVDGLSEAIKALGRIDKEIKGEAVAVLRDASKKVQALAQSNIGKGLYRGPMQRGMIGRSATATGAATKLRAKKYPWAFKAEYGEKVAHVYGHPTRQTKFRRRTANRWSPPTSQNLFKNKGGYMIQPAIRKLGPFVIQEANEEMFKLIDRTLKRAM